MPRSMLTILVFWSCSILALGAGKATIEQWWVPLGCCLAFLCVWLQRNSIEIPRAHRKWLMLYGLWWIALLLPVPVHLVDIVQGDLGTYRELLHTYVGDKHSTIAIHPSHHLLNGAIPLMLYGFYSVARSSTVSNTLWNRMLLWPLLAFSTYGILQHLLHLEFAFGLSAHPSYLRGPLFGTFINGNHAAYFMVCGLHLNQYSDTKKTHTWMVVFLLAIGVWICGSRGAIGLFIGSLFWLHRPTWATTGRTLTVLMTVLILATIGYSQEFDAFSHGRLQLWFDSLGLFKWSWHLGLGMAGFSSAYPLVKSIPEYIHSTHLHMEYLEWIFNTGLIGTVLMLRVLWGCWKGRHTVGPWFGIVLVLGIASLVDFPLQLNAIALFWTLAFGRLSTVPSQDSTKSGKVLSYTMIGTAMVVWILPILHPMYATKDKTGSPSVSNHLLHPTLLEQHIWTEVQQIPVSQEDPLLFELPLDGSTEQTVLTLNPIIERHAKLYRSNIEAQRLLARWYRRLGQFEESCRIWHSVWTLKTPTVRRKDAWVAEGLACHPNIWLVLSTLPSDTRILLKSAQILNAQSQVETVRFLLDRAVESETPPVQSLLHLTQWHIQQKDFKSAWLLQQRQSSTLLQTTAQRCAYWKNEAALGKYYLVEGTHQIYQALLDECGTKPHWQNNLWFSGLKEGIPSIIEEVEEVVSKTPSKQRLFWLHLQHAHSLQNNAQEACQWLQIGFRKFNRTPSAADLKACLEGSVPSVKSNWIVQPRDTINAHVAQ